MAAAAHVFPNYTQQMGTHNTNQIDLSGGTVDTIKVGLISSSTTFNFSLSGAQSIATVTNFLAGDGTNGALTELTTTGSGYSRQSLVSPTYTNSGLVSKLTTGTNPSWSATSSWTAYYAFFYDYTAGGSSDTAGLMICYWDFGGGVSVTNGGTFTLSINASGLVTWTSS